MPTASYSFLMIFVVLQATAGYVAETLVQVAPQLVPSMAIELSQMWAASRGLPNASPFRPIETRV